MRSAKYKLGGVSSCNTDEGARMQTLRLLEEAVITQHPGWGSLGTSARMGCCRVAWLEDMVKCLHDPLSLRVSPQA
ncbi:hypothetical protein MHYP_G00340910 [Metynnis hypsauchen]